MIPPEDVAWARDLLHEWRAVALSNSMIYTYGFVSSPSLKDPKKEGNDENNTGSLAARIGSLILLFLLTIVSVVIQTVIPIAISITLPTPDGLCPRNSDFLTKFIGLTLCLFFVVLTISMCLSKLRGIGFLKLFCSNDVETLGYYRFFLDLGILSNIVSMAAAGITQYILFIKNAESNHLLLLLQSLATQFVLTADEKLMTGAWKAWTRRRLEILMKHDNERQLLLLNDGVEGGTNDNDDSADDAEGKIQIDEMVLKKVKLMYYAESGFLVMVSVVGIIWSIGLAYCM